MNSRVTGMRLLSPVLPLLLKKTTGGSALSTLGRPAAAASIQGPRAS